MSKQQSLDPFFGISKDKEKEPPKGSYIPFQTSNNTSTKASPSKDYTFVRNNEQKPAFQPNQSATSSFNISLDDCWTYALPCHIPKIWKKVKPLLTEVKEGKIGNAFKLREVIHEFIQVHYSSTLRNLNLQVLSSFLDELSSDQIREFFTKVLPFMAKLGLEVENLFKDPLLILKQNRAQIVNLTKKQVACLLVHMFFCTMHKQNNTQLRSDCNFTNLYRDSRRKGVKLEKIRSLYNYFRRLSQGYSEGDQISYERIVLKPKTHGSVNLDFWKNSTKPLRNCVIKDKGSIEDEDDAIQVDFANRCIGGGVLDSGCVQEEIRFLIGPELLITLLICENLLDHEAVIVAGTEIYSKYTGYSDSFKYAGNAQQNLQLDSFLRRDSMVLAIDAIDFSRTGSLKTQFKVERILREINKAYIGFWGSELETGNIRKGIATGRWGCGAFRGDSQLKFILQWLAASQASRNMSFYRFDDVELKDAERIVKSFKGSNVKDLFAALIAYNSFLFKEGDSMTLFDFLQNVD